MTEGRRMAAVVFVLLGLAGVPGSLAAGAAPPRVKDGEAIVTFTRGSGLTAMQAAATGVHPSATIVRSMAAAGRPNTVLVRFPKSTPIEEMVARLRGEPGVLAVQPNRMDRNPFLTPSLPLPARPAFGARGAGGDPSVVLSTPSSHTVTVGYSSATVSATGTATSAYLPNDPGWTQQPALTWMDYQYVFPDKAPSPMVAVLGSGVDASHPDLVGKIVKGTDWVNGDKDPDDDFGVGTMLAGQIAALINNGKGITGLSNGKVLAIKVEDAEGWWTEFDVAAGIQEAANNPLVKVITLRPLQGGGWESSLIRDAIQTAVNKGKLLVLPAGDENTSDPRYPGYYSHPSFTSLSSAVISVAATGGNSWTGCPGPGCRSSVDYNCKMTGDHTSNYGDWISVIAPGYGIYSTAATYPVRGYLLDQGYGFMFDTTIAAAEVAATAARVWSVMPAGTTAAQVKERLVTVGYTRVPDGKTRMLDTDRDGVADTPCQPPEMNDAAVMPSFAGGMRRAAVFGWLFDAHIGSRLATPVTVGVYQGAKAKGYGGYGGDGSARFGIIDLPMDNVTLVELRVNVRGYTAGPVTIGKGTVSDCGGGASTLDCIRDQVGQISLPKNLLGQVHVVTDWNNNDLDTHLFTPSSAPIKCDVGLSPISSLYCFLGSLTSAPFARLLRHGPDNTHSELLSIKTPLYPTASGTPYRIYLVDYDNNTIRTSGAVTRLWTGGKIVAQVATEDGDVTTNDCDYGGGANRCGAFWVGDLAGTGVFTPKAIYGTLSDVAPGVLPYSAARGGGSLGGGRP